MHLEYTLIEGDFVNAGSASSSIKKTLKQLNVNPAIVKRVVIALYEAEVNAVAHAYGGKVTADIEADTRRKQKRQENGTEISTRMLSLDSSSDTGENVH